jgi:hypothetical protein
MQTLVSALSDPQSTPTDLHAGSVHENPTKAPRLGSSDRRFRIVPR